MGAVVSHRLPGRLRVAIDEIRSQAIQAYSLQCELTQTSGIVGAECNPDTGRALIHFDEGVTSEEEILGQIDSFLRPSVITYDKTNEVAATIESDLSKPTGDVLRTAYKSFSNPYLVPTIASSGLLGALSLKRLLMGRSALAASPITFWAAAGISIVSGYPALRRGVESLIKERKVSPDLWMGLATLSMAALRENLVALSVITAVNFAMYRRYTELDAPEDTELSPELEEHSRSMSRLSLLLTPLTLLLTRSPLRALGVALAANPRPAILSHKYRWARAEQEAAEHGLIGSTQYGLSSMALAKSIVFANEELLTGAEQEWMVYPLKENLEVGKAVAIAASLLQRSDKHPWKQALVDRATRDGRSLHTPFEVEDSDEGVRGLIQGHKIMLGVHSFVVKHGVEETSFLLDERRMRRQGYTTQILIVEGHPVALIGVKKSIDQKWLQTIEDWRRTGYQVRILKSDRFRQSILESITSDELLKELDAGKQTIFVGGQSLPYHKHLVSVSIHDYERLPSVLAFCHDKRRHTQRDLRIVRLWNLFGAGLALVSPPLAPLLALCGDVVSMFLISAQHWSRVFGVIKEKLTFPRTQGTKGGLNTRAPRERLDDSIQTWKLSEVLRKFEADRDGLTRNQVLQRQAKWGPNILETHVPPSPFRIFARQFKELSTVILLGTAGLSFAMGERFSALCMVGILVLNALIGTWQEKRSNEVIQALKVDDDSQSKVLRDSVEQHVASRDLVPGDIVLLEPGDRVPADIRIIEAWNLEANEAMLTGESTPVAKFEGDLDNDAQLAERFNTLFMGTVITRGRCKGLVYAIGDDTEIGRLGTLINQQEETPTYLQTKVSEVSKRFVIGAFIAAGIVAGVGLIRGIPPIQLLISSVTLAASAIPEGLPLTITVALTAGVMKMSKRQAVIKKLANLESLGRVTVICTDKTGTLTKNEMTVKEIATVGNRVNVTGDGYLPVGVFYSVDQPDVQLSLEHHHDVRQLLTIGLLSNNARFEDANNEEPIGDPTEIALLIAGAKAHLNLNEWKRHREIPFDSGTRSMSVVCESDIQGKVVCEDNRRLKKCTLFTKGAPETVLEKCSFYLLNGEVHTLTEEIKQRVQSENLHMANQSLRVLAFAYKDLGDDEDPMHVEDNAMIYVGLMGMMDPPKEGVAESIAEARLLGIKPVMITGDHPSTAKAIGLSLGIFQEGDQVLTGKDIDSLSEKDLEQRVVNTSVFARVSPEQKLRIVEAFQRIGEVVAMTGDGVNDAPAIRRADVGIAMGRKGTDITKGTAGIVLMQDHFHSIVDGVKSGRAIIGNIRKAMGCLLSGNLAEVLVTALSVIIGLPIPLIPLQILLMNILTDAIPAMVLATGSTTDVPEKPYKDVIDKELYQNVLTRGVTLGLGAVGVFAAALTFGLTLPVAQTMAYASLVVGQLWQTLAWRRYGSRSKRGFKNDRVLLTATLGSFAALAATIYIPVLRTVFATVPLGFAQWGIVLAVTGALAWTSQKVIHRVTRERQPRRAASFPCPMLAAQA